MLYPSLNTEARATDAGLGPEAAPEAVAPEPQPEPFAKFREGLYRPRRMSAPPIQPRLR